MRCTTVPSIAIEISIDPLMGSVLPVLLPVGYGFEVSSFVCHV
jgi:hypothetical protein